jgi:hypothetical protein
MNRDAGLKLRTISVHSVHILLNNNWSGVFSVFVLLRGLLHFGTPELLRFSIFGPLQLIM